MHPPPQGAKGAKAKGAAAKPGAKTTPGGSRLEKEIFSTTYTRAKRTRA